MKTIYIKLIATPTTNDGTKISINTDKPIISVNIDNITLSLAKDQFDFKFEQEIKISDKEINKLEDTTSEIEDEEDIRFKISEGIRNRSVEVLKYLTYYYGITEIKESFSAVGQVEWSLNNKDWFEIVTKYPHKWISGSAIYYLPENLPSLFPHLLKTEPFIAFEFLHKAFNESNPKFSWISATVAAELGFKEFVSKLDNRLSYLITNLPSPPLNKLYNQTLKDLSGEPSPFYSKLYKGYEFRNQIVHNPTTKFAPPFSLEMYLQIVHSAMLNILT